MNAEPDQRAEITDDRLLNGRVRLLQPKHGYRAGMDAALLAAACDLAPGEPPFDLALANPPFFDDPNALRAPAPEKRQAWIADTGLDAWTRFLLKAVRDGGRVLVIHRAERLLDLLALLSGQAGSFQIRPVHPFADEPAKRVLVRAVKSGKAPLKLLPPLVLHDRSGAKHTPEAEAVFRGEAALEWER